jgi:hypothetical protein
MGRGFSVHTTAVVDYNGTLSGGSCGSIFVSRLGCSVDRGWCISHAGGGVDSLGLLCYALMAAMGGWNGGIGTDLITSKRSRVKPTYRREDHCGQDNQKLHHENKHRKNTTENNHVVGNQGTPIAETSPLHTQYATLTHHTHALRSTVHPRTNPQATFPIRRSRSRQDFRVPSAHPRRTHRMGQASLQGYLLPTLVVRRDAFVS